MKNAQIASAQSNQNAARKWNKDREQKFIAEKDVEQPFSKKMFLDKSQTIKFEYRTRKNVLDWSMSKTQKYIK